MTREEAIKMLKGIGKYLCSGNPVWNTNEVAEAIRIAIVDMRVVPKFLEAFKTQKIKQWIPCSERLPKQQQRVLIQDFGLITIGYLNAENRWRDLTNLDDYLKGVVAWMPLPEPYKEDE